MKCAFCLEEMNEGATVCKVCAREQPPTTEAKAQKRDNIILFAMLGAIAMVGVGLGGWALLSTSAENRAVDRAVAASRFCGHPSAESIVRMNIENYHDQGLSWERAGDMERIMACPGMATGD